MMYLDVRPLGWLKLHPLNNDGSCPTMRSSRHHHHDVHHYFHFHYFRYLH
jgi:hypothetical protein